MSLCFVLEKNLILYMQTRTRTLDENITQTKFNINTKLQ